MGRSFVGHPLEDDCPCEQEPCGLIHSANTNPDCPQHGWDAAKTIRQAHSEDSCPGPEKEEAL